METLDWDGGTMQHAWRRRMATPTGVLCTALLVQGVVSALLLVAFDDGAAPYAGYLFVGQPHTDSWGPMAQAVRHLRASPHEPIYTRLFFTDRTKFQYPVSALVALDLFQRATALSWDRVFAVLNRLSWWCVLMTGAFSWALFSRGGPDARVPDHGDPRPVAQVSGLVVGLGLTSLYYPLTQSYVLGQIQTWLTCLAALALLMWTYGRRGAAAVALGLCCAIKPQWWVFVLWAMLRREWLVVRVTTATAAASVLASVALYGAHHYVDYVRVLTYLTLHGEAYYPNQSVNGLVNRLVFNGNNLEWLGSTFPPFDPAVYICTVVATVAFAGTALLWRRQARATPLDVALVILSVTMASPIAWEHHYGVLLPILALLGAASVSDQARWPHARWVVLSAYVLSGQRLEITNRLAGTRFNVLQSYLFAGALIALLSLYLLGQPVSHDGAVHAAGRPGDP